MAQVGIGDVAYKNPSNFEHALPLVRSPNSAASCIIHGGQHFRHTAKVATDKAIRYDRPKPQKKKRGTSR